MILNSRLIPCSLAISALFLPHTLAALVPMDLRCEGMDGVPAVIATPGLSWRVESADRDQAQSAWQVLVASSEALLAKDKGDLWNSGKVPATRSPIVPYAGRPLVSGQRCHWKARSWDTAGKVSAWSQSAAWQVSPLSPADWQGARWIDDGRKNPERDEDFYKPDPAPLLRKEFTLEKPVVSARLHVAGLGYALASINGQRLADQPLDPPWTNFDKRILFRTHDVTSSLTEGANCLGLTLGNGWYNPLPLRMWGGRNIREALPTGRPRAIACLIVEHPDGTTTRIVTGPGWRVAKGSTVRNSVFLGEERDARLDKPGWDKPGFDDSTWKSARITGDSLEPLKPILDMPPVRATETIPAVAVTSPAKGIYIVDFGTNFTGVPEIRLNVPAGKRIALRYGEILHPNGTLNPMTSVCGQIKGMRTNAKGEEHPIGGPGAPLIAWQQDVYTARGGDGETYRPEFTFHAFRYMEITGLSVPPKPEDIVGIRLHSALPDAGSFSCSNELFNRIQNITRNTFRNNVVSVQSDCPHRERFGYGGDIAVTSEAFLMNFDMAGFYAKTVRDWADAARPDGRLTDTAPFVGIDYCGVGWAMVHPLLLEQLHQHYGSVSLLEEQVPVAIRWLDNEAAMRKDGLVVNGLSDHESIAKAGGPVLTTPMFIDAARRVGRLARLIGREADAARCQTMADESAAAWTVAFLDADTGRIGDGSQSNQTFALGFGAAPTASRALVFQQLLDGLKAPDGPRLTTGIFGTRFLLEELSRNGRSDQAFALADRKTFPSWGWMLENDATTLWEHWAGGDNSHSHNHPMFGSISAWFFRWLGGIQVADDAVGFDRIEIRPQVVPGLEWVKCSHRSVRGLIESNWKTTDKGTEFDILIPPDTTAEIELPVGTITSSDVGGAPVLEVHGAQIKVASGRYQFTVSRN